MILIFWILAISFSGPITCPDRMIDVLEQKCRAEKPELFFYMSKDSAIKDYSVMPTTADEARLYKVEVQWPKNKFSSDFDVQVYSMELRPVKSYEVKVATRTVQLWR